jgi:hypothetical protein
VQIYSLDLATMFDYKDSNSFIFYEAKTADNKDA